MIMRFGRRAGVVPAAALLILSMQAAAIAAEKVDAIRLPLDTEFTGAVGKTVTDEPASIRNCARFAGGARPGTDGWRFDQPVPGGAVRAYTIGFIATIDGTPGAVLLGLTGDSVVRINVTPATLQGQFGPEDLLPVPAGVSGGLIDGGAGGSWLNTPTGWRLAAGALLVDGTAGDREAFALVAVCLPGAPASPSTSPSASASPSPSPSPSATHSSPTPSASPTATPPDTGGLPITGNRSGVVAFAGLAAVVIGGLLLAVRRRRDKVRFRA